MKKYLVNGLMFIAIMGLFVVSGYNKSEFQSEVVEKPERTVISVVAVQNLLNK